jgi:hypothetical protein
MDSRMGEATDKQVGESMLLELSIAAHNALVDEVGMGKAMSAMRPYIANTAHFTVHGAIPSHFGMTMNSLKDMVLVLWKTHETVFHGHAESVFYGDQTSWANRVIGCQTEGKSPLICAMWCQQYPYLALKEFEAKESQNSILTRSLLWGDAECAWEPDGPVEVWKKGVGVPVQLPVVSEEQIHYLTLAYRGENLAIVTKASIDACGEAKATEMLAKAAWNAGSKYGTRLKDDLAQGADLNLIQGMIGSCLKPFQVIGAVKTTSSEVAGEVKECPFSGSPPEVCDQIEAFWNGAVQSFDPGYEFSYDHMMTKGDMTCHWTIRKKVKLTKEKPKGEVPSSEVNERKTALKALALKYAQGEITKEEYNELKELIQE